MKRGKRVVHLNPVFIDKSGFPIFITKYRNRYEKT
jgi:hypothetical protein